MDNAAPAVAAVGGVVVLGAVLTIPALLIIKAWLVDGSMDFALAASLLMGLFVMVSLAWVTQGTVWMLVFVGIVLVACAAVPLLAERQNALGNKELRDEDIEKYKRAIERDPKNASAYVFLGDALLERGSVVAAIAQYEHALALVPTNGVWKRKLERAKEQSPN